MSMTSLGPRYTVLYKNDAGAAPSSSIAPKDISGYDEIRICATKMDGSDYNWSWSSAPVINVTVDTTGHSGIPTTKEVPTARGCHIVYYMVNSGTVQTFSFSWKITAGSFAYDSASYSNVRTNVTTGQSPTTGPESSPAIRISRIIGVKY